jgi:hypothetical protein
VCGFCGLVRDGASDEITAHDVASTSAPAKNRLGVWTFALGNKLQVLYGSSWPPYFAGSGDIVVFNLPHIGIVAKSGRGHFHSVEGNTTPSIGGNQGYIVDRRLRSQHLLKGLIRLPPKHRFDDYNISSRISHMV